MSKPLQDEAAPRRPNGAKLPCETPGCSERCSHAYSCHEERMGRGRHLAWPLVALAIFVVIGVLF